MKKIKICIMGKFDGNNKVAYQTTFKVVDSLPEIGDCVSMSAAPNLIYTNITEVEPDMSSRGKAEGYKFYVVEITDIDEDEEKTEEYIAIEDEMEV